MNYLNQSSEFTIQKKINNLKLLNENTEKYSIEIPFYYDIIKDMVNSINNPDNTTNDKFNDIIKKINNVTGNKLNKSSNSLIKLKIKNILRKLRSNYKMTKNGDLEKRCNKLLNIILLELD